MRGIVGVAALCVLTACEGTPSGPYHDAQNLAESGAAPTLKIAVRGLGEVTHTADQAGLTSCSTLPPNPAAADCVRTYAHNAVVTLQAKPAAGFTFHHWGGPCTGTGTCTVTMDERRALEAIFKATTSPPPASYTLKILVRGRGTVTHSPDQGGLASCAVQPAASVAECVRTFPAGSEIVLTAQAATGFRFVGWSGACAIAGTGTCTLKANENRALEVKFEG